MRDLKAVTNLTYNYVLSDFQGDTPSILKLGFDNAGFEARMHLRSSALQDMAQLRCLLKIMAYCFWKEQCPAHLLKAIFQIKNINLSKFPAELSKNCTKIIPKEHIFHHIKYWLAALDKDCPIPVGYLQKARKLRNELLQSLIPDILLHGDLHHNNILQNADGWFVIDPKGVIGKPAYEVVAFIRNPMLELLNHL
ncbi:aminoglycoside phosphotransferase family protein [Holospora undulata]|uniref:Aminoglycoside/hydroxyurea antibiotic resistance kinase n=1 Tax=Holospora undulata HU1 TaxID=1321371 RepID=A0A061JI91_9PROT|nr:aminoglycoside phosphotransferase family protein [Holospora undulata]ETZ04729.1 aminoglycoside/hydroxyurea antibiotic resistance kinase [Holospora undulata HU1]